MKLIIEAPNGPSMDISEVKVTLTEVDWDAITEGDHTKMENLDQATESLTLALAEHALARVISTMGQNVGHVSAILNFVVGKLQDHTIHAYTLKRGPAGVLEDLLASFVSNANKSPGAPKVSIIPVNLDQLSKILRCKTCEDPNCPNAGKDPMDSVPVDKCKLN